VKVQVPLKPLDEILLPDPRNRDPVLVGGAATGPHSNCPSGAGILVLVALPRATAHPRLA
jgi:hypothetical protein